MRQQFRVKNIVFPHLEILRNIQNSSDIERALVIEVTKGTEKIRRVDLP